MDDPERIAYLGDHLEVAAGLATGNVPGFELGGYYVWTLLDNFEWAAGYSQRFGVVHVDFDSLVRTPKSSYRWIQDLQAERGRDVNDTTVQ